MSSEVSSVKTGDDHERGCIYILTEIEDLVGRMSEGTALWGRILFFPHNSCIQKHKKKCDKSSQESSLAKLQSSSSRMKVLQMNLPGCALAWIIMFIAHMSTSLVSAGSESIGLMILSFVMIGVMAIAMCISFVSEKTWRAPAMNALLLMSLTFVFATLISRLITITEVCLLYKVGVLRTVMLIPIMVFDHPIATGAFVLSGDLGIGLILGIGQTYFENGCNSSYAQTAVGLILYMLAFSLSILIILARTKIRNKLSDTLEKLCEISLIQVSMISHLQGIPNYYLRLEKVDPLANNTIVPMQSTAREFQTPREDHRLVSGRRIQHGNSRVRIMSMATQQRTLTQNSNRNYGQVRSSTSALPVKEPAKTGFKLTTSGPTNSILDNFEDFMKNTFFTSASNLQIERILTDQQVLQPEYEEAVDKFKAYLSTCTETKSFYPIYELWIELGDMILSKYDCLVRLEYLSHKSPLESSYHTKSVLIYSIGKRSETCKSLYIKIRNEVGYHVPVAPSPHRFKRDRSADKSDRQGSAISGIYPMIRKSIPLSGVSSIYVKPLDSRMSVPVEENRIPSASDWPDFEKNKEFQHSGLSRLKPDSHKLPSVDSQGPSSDFSKVVHFIESSTSEKDQDDNGKFHFPDDKSIITPTNNIGTSPPDRSLSKHYQNHMRINPKPVEKASPPTTNQSMEELISMVVHDMRSPLMCIQGNMELIAFELKDKPNFQPVEPLIKATIAASSLLETLVSDVLDSARISKGIFKITADPMDLEETMIECIETLRIAANSRKNILVCEFNCTSKLIVSDKQRIKQVMLNFLSNSIKFTSQGKIYIKVYDTLDTVRITIEDNGTGIKKENIGKLFEKFSSDRDTRSNAKGIGLGLFICKSIIEALGPKKDIAVTSEPNVKTTITFEIFKDVNRGALHTVKISRNTMDGSRSRLKSEMMSVHSCSRSLHRDKRR